MCVVSMVGDDWRERTIKDYPWTEPSIPSYPYPVTIPPEVTKEEVDALRQELKALKKLLKAAKIYDEETGQPDCEVDEKVGFIRKLAELLEVDIDL